MSELFAFLPNLVTLCNLFSGFFSIYFALTGELVMAGWFIVLGFVWDSLDGNIARIFKNTSPIGGQLDSLSDIVSFVVAPAFLALTVLQPSFKKAILLPAILFYLATGAYRLARFNAFPYSKLFFEGLPTPAAGCALALTAVTLVQSGLIKHPSAILLFYLLLLLAGVLMVSKVRYPKFTSIPLAKWRSFLFFEGLFFLVCFKFWSIETAGAVCFFVFIFFSPAYTPRGLKAV